MNLTKNEKNNYVRDVVLKHFNFFRNSPVGAMLLDTDYNILAVNELCQSRFGTVNLVGKARELICPKFDINDANVNYLVEVACKMGYHLYIPIKLMSVRSHCA